MSEQHTPGPWVVGKINHKKQRVDIDVPCGDPSRHMVAWEAMARAYGDDDMPEAGSAVMMANARLIAAAPDLLDELKKAHELLHLALRFIPNEALPAFVDASDTAGLGTDGCIRHHERKAVIDRAEGGAA